MIANLGLVCGLLSHGAQAAATEPQAPAELEPPAELDPPPVELEPPAELAPPPVFDFKWEPIRDVWLRPGALLQVRLTFNRRPEEVTEPNTARLTIPRVRILLDGGLTRFVSFRLRIGKLNEGNMSFEQAYGNLHLGRVTIRAGVLYLPASIADGPAPQALQGIDYSQYGLEASGGQAAGVGVLGEFGPVRLQAFMSNGARTSFTELATPINAKFPALTGRAEVRLFTRDGFDRFDTESSFRGSDLALRLGAAGHFQRSRNEDSPAEALTQVTTDATLEGPGFNVIVAGRFLYSPLAEGPALLDGGVLVQAGVFLHEYVELWARYDGLYGKPVVHPVPPFSGPGTQPFHEVGSGLNVLVLPRTQNVKLQVDGVYIPLPLASTLVDSSNVGGILDTSTKHQWSIRGQFLLAF